MRIKKKRLRLLVNSLETYKMLNLQPKLKKTIKPIYSYNLFKDGLTQSALSTFLQCPQKFKRYMLDGFVSERSTFALDFGNIFHYVLDQVYTNFKEADSVDSAIDRAKEALAAGYEETLEKIKGINLINGDIEEELFETYALARVVAIHYMQKWFKEDKKKNWVSLEHKFENIYRGREEKYAVKLKGKIDGVFSSGKELSLLETKTKGQIIEREITDILTFDLQNFFYLLNAKLIYGRMPTTVLYNVVRRPQLRRGKNETQAIFLQRVDKDIEDRSDFYFMRWPVSITKADFNDWEAEFKMMLDRLVDTYLNNLYYKNSMACTGGKGTCQYLGLCARNDIFGLKRREVLFPELEVL